MRPPLLGCTALDIDGGETRRRGFRRGGTLRQATPDAEAATTRCRENGNGYPTGGPWDMRRPEPKVDQDFLNDLWLLGDCDDSRRAATLGAQQGIRLIDLLDESCPLALCGVRAPLDNIPRLRWGPFLRVPPLAASHVAVLSVVPQEVLPCGREGREETNRFEWCAGRHVRIPRIDFPTTS